MYFKLPKMTAYTTSHTVQKACKTKKSANNIDKFFFLLAALLHFHCFVCTEAVLVGKKWYCKLGKKQQSLKELHEPHYNCKRQKKKNTKSMLFLYIHISLAFIQNYCRHYKPRSTSWPSTLASLTTSSNKSQKCELKCHATTALAEGQNIHRLETSCTLIERLGRGVKAKNAQVT